MPFSNILRGVFPQSFCVAVFSLFVYVYNKVIELKGGTYLPLLSFPPLPFSLTSPSLGLLLVFRTNTAYARWRDSRIAWATISSKAFNLMRQGASYFSDRKLIADLARYTVVFALAAKFHLSPGGDLSSLREELGDILSLSELEDFLKAKNKLRKAVIELTGIIKKAELISSTQSHMDKGEVSLGVYLMTHSGRPMRDDGCVLRLRSDLHDSDSSLLYPTHSSFSVDMAAYGPYGAVPGVQVGEMGADSDQHSECLVPFRH